MKCSREHTTRSMRFLIAMILATAGFLAFSLSISSTAMATDADTIEQQTPATEAQDSVVPEAVATETQNVDAPVLDTEAAAGGADAQVSEPDENSVEQSAVPADAEQAVSEEDKQQFLARQIFFAFNSCTLDEQAQVVVREQAAWLATNPDVSVQIVGYCDQSGSKDYNMALGKKRANAVKNSLENLGISPQRLTEVSYGEQSPVRTTTNQAAARINRRVEFKIQPAA
nr:OmpA family protein [uncultured Desulfobacter sp.]